MSDKPVNDAPAPAQKTQPQPVPNLNNLSRLSESSTGDWERGKPSGNARSPKTSTSVLEQTNAKLNDLAIGDSPAQAPRAANVQSGFVPEPSQHRAQSPLHPRLQREGYGFRPASGASTPTGSQIHQSPLVSALPTDDKELEDEEMNTRLNDEVRNALKEPATSIATTTTSNELLPPGGIADANGLGWPGMHLANEPIRLTDSQAHSPPTPVDSRGEG